METLEKKTSESLTQNLMMAVGHSEHIDPIEACKNIFTQINNKLNGMSPDAGIIYMNIEEDQKTVLHEVKKKWPNMELIGCSTCGEISSGYGYADDLIALVVFKSDILDIVVGIGKEASKDINKACVQAVEEIKSKTNKPIKLCFVLPESLTTSGEDIIDILNQNFGGETPIFGGTSSDNFTLTGTNQYYNNEVLSDSVPIIAFAGDLVMSYGVGCGWNPIGKMGIITKSDKNIVYEINKKSALSFYQDLLGKELELTGEYFLAIFDENDEVSYMRFPMYYNYEDGSIAFAANVPEGSKIKITITNRESILNGCDQSINNAYNNFPKDAELAGSLIVSCAGRKSMLGSKVKNEYDIIKSVIKEDIPILGFYGYGEIATKYTATKIPQFHNGNFISLLLGTKI